MSIIDVSELLTKIPAQPLAARLILRLVEDPDASTAQIARLVEMDPALSARVMRLANAPHYGVTSGVHSAQRAVILLGASTVRGLAAAAATTLLTDDVTLGPDDYWAHALGVAAGAAVAGDALGVPGNEAFSAGLLHDIGSALLHRANPAKYDRMIAALGRSSLEEGEIATFGVSHAEAGALALEEWRFPESFVQAVRMHHDAPSSATPLARTIMLGESLAEQLEPMGSPERTAPLPRLLAQFGIASSSRVELLLATRRAMADAAGFFGEPA